MKREKLYWRVLLQPSDDWGNAANDDELKKLKSVKGPKQSVKEKSTKTTTTKTGTKTK